MQGPPTEQGLAHSLQNAIKDTLLFGFYLYSLFLILTKMEIISVLLSLISIIGNYWHRICFSKNAKRNVFSFPKGMGDNPYLYVY